MGKSDKITTNKDAGATQSKTETPRKKAAEKYGGGMGGFAKGLSVIEAFGASNEGLTIADIARLTGLDRATARRCVITLVHTGYATANGRLYTLTPKVLRLSAAYLNAPLPSLIQPSLENVAEKLHESCSASVLDGGEIVYIARAAQLRVMSIGLNTGSRLPAYCSSMGRVLLAALPEDEARERLEASDRIKRTEKTLTDIDDLLQELERVRRNGYAINDQELEVGLRSIAVPVYNMAGDVVAALNVGVQAARRSTKDLKTDILPILLEEQEKLRQHLP